MALLWALVLLPAVTGAMLAVTPNRWGRFAAPVSLTAAVITVVLSVLVAVGRPAVEVPFVAGSAFGLSVDGPSVLLVPTLSVVTLLVLVFATGDVRTAPGRFHGLMLLFSAAALVTATATTLPTLLFAWEVMGAASYALIGFWWGSERRVTSGLIAFLTTRAADLGLYLAAAAALAGGSGLALRDLPDAASPWRDVVAAGMAVAALGKAAQLPFSFWLSRAMDGPSPVSALLHSAAMVAMGGYLLLRVAPLLTATSWAAPTVAWVGAVTAVLLGAVALAQSDLKQLLAASTSAQLGFVVLAAGVSAIAGGTAQLVAHAATKALLFLVAGAWLSALGTKRLSVLRGVGRRWPGTGVLAAAGALSLAGVPPLALWATKDAVLTGALHESVALYVVGLAGSTLSAAYAAKILAVLWRRTQADTEAADTEAEYAEAGYDEEGYAEAADAEAGYDEEEPGTRRIGPLMRIPLVPLAFAAVTLSALGLPPIAGWTRGLVGDPAEPAATGWELTGSAVLAIAVVLLVWGSRLSGPLERTAALHGWLGLEALAVRAVARPVMWLAQRLATFDDRVLDRTFVRAGTSPALWLAGHAATFDDAALDRSVSRAGTASVALAGRTEALERGGLDGVVEGIASGIRLLARLARRPQTGLLHQYYIQAACVLAAAIVVLVVVR